MDLMVNNKCSVICSFDFLLIKILSIGIYIETWKGLQTDLNTWLISINIIINGIDTQ